MYFSGKPVIRMMMKSPSIFFSYYLSSGFRTAYAKLTNKKFRSKYYAGHFVLPNKKSNELLIKAIIKGEPFMFGRHGSNELRIATEGLFYLQGIQKDVQIQRLKHSFEHCGLYPMDLETIVKFYRLIEESSQSTDIYGTFRMIMEDYYIRNHMKHNVILTNLNAMDFWQYEVPFTSALKGKDVLVIHPLAELISNQYKNRDKLFANDNVLPEFNLKTIKAVQTIAGQRDNRFADWFEALEYMHQKSKEIKYDVALLGCGAYGMPLASRLKSDGKVVIYVGGVLQMLFGIKGGRWDNHPIASQLYNQYWVRPCGNDVPAKSKQVENGCYW